jgi:hypothetical protein
VADEEEQEMDDVVNRFAKELADAIAAAVAENPQVEACRAKAREAGFDMRVTLEAVVGFVSRNNGAAVTKITTPARLLPARKAFDLTTNDRRFLRSLRIGIDEASKEAVDNIGRDSTMMQRRTFGPLLAYALHYVRLCLDSRPRCLGLGRSLIAQVVTFSGSIFVEE